MFELENLGFYSLEVDFSNCLPTKEAQTNFEMDFLSKVNLGMLKSTSFDELQIALGEIRNIVPEIEYTKQVSANRVRISLFEKKET